MLRSLSNEAQADLDAAIDWYLAADAFSAADDLVDEIEHAITLLQAFSDLGVVSSHTTRVFTLRKFPFRLVYRVFPDHIRIIAVAHQRRLPRFWRDRT